ncbi:E3 ubiquitin-protein ligase TRIM11-like [Hypomesus transpacificus]|uniref:E3 ubiquitin-protein ligase TRIM11-like n=1 Tax=Hypomesus transpacificus TaxID=137520 RepID=UPI001F08569A|nr:E3 ubiquitin-protein ligase TRIM11-like [Hypomesus transpacificus]
MLPCGHTFCLSCIRTVWNTDLSAEGPFFCPECQILLPSDLTLEVEPTLQAKTASVAIRTCLTCDASLCRAHATLHQQRAVLRQHVLVEVTRDPLSLKCREHQEQLKLFCVEEQLPVCSLCLLVGRHQHHQALQLQDASAELKKMLDTTMTQLLQRRMSAEQAIKDLEALYTETMKSTAAFRSRISDKYSRIRGLIEEDENLMVKMVDSEEVFISEWLEAQRQVLEEQIKESDSLRSTSMSLIQETNDLIFLQRITAHGLGRTLDLPPLREVEKQICSPEKLRTIERLVDALTLALSQHFPRMWSYLRALTLDPSTAHPQLLVSQDRQQVRWGTQPSAGAPGCGRQDAQYSILARESFSTGRHYWEVLVQEKPFWLIGTTTGATGSQEGGPTKGLADQKKASWCIYHGDGQYLACHNAQETLLSVGSRVVKLGMMADLQQGALSFYDADTLTLLHRFCVPCLEPLYPMFNPCINMNDHNRQPLTLFRLRDADRSRSVGGGAAGTSQSPS